MKEDSADLERAERAVEGRLRKSGYTPQILVEGHLVWHPGLDVEWVWVRDTPPTAGTISSAKNAGGWYHIPDVMVLSGEDPDASCSSGAGAGIGIYNPVRPVALVVEIDGGVHDAKRTKTEARNHDYRRAGVPYVTVSKSDCKSVGRKWGMELEKAVGLFVP